MRATLCIRLGAALAGLAVGLGAFAAHGMKGSYDAVALQTFETGVRYQMYHALALLAVAWLCERSPGRLPRGAGLAFLAGIALFSGSLYAMALSGITVLGAITPLGGVAFLAGWVLLAIAATKV